MGFSGARFRSRRTALGISAANLGQMVGVQQPQITRFETGTRTPSCELLPVLAKQLHCTIDYFFPEMDDVQPEAAAPVQQMDDVQPEAAAPAQQMDDVQPETAQEIVSDDDFDFGTWED